jgi:transposase
VVERLVFIDETGLNTKMTRLYGRAKRSERCIASAPFGHWHSNTFIAALRVDGLHAPWLLNGAMNGESFLTYVTKVLGPTLRTGDIVICDNLSSHKVGGVAEAIKEVGAQICYLPPYSPDLNPIEMAFAKLKAYMRGQSPREFPKLMQALVQALKTFSPEHCRNFLKHAQYATN